MSWSSLPDAHPGKVTDPVTDAIARESTSMSQVKVTLLRANSWVVAVQLCAKDSNWQGTDLQRGK